MQTCHVMPQEGMEDLYFEGICFLAVNVTLCTCHNTVRFLERGYRWKIMDVMLRAHADACMCLFIQIHFDFTLQQLERWDKRQT